MRVLQAWLPALLALFGAISLARQADESAPVSELASVSDLDGRAARLADAPEMAVLLYFHAGSSRYSLTGLDELVERVVTSALEAPSS